MKRLLIGDSREELLSTLEVILRHWGYRVLVSSRPERIEALLRETSPDLLIMGSKLLDAGKSSLVDAVSRAATEGKCPLIVLQEEQADHPVAAPHEMLGVPLDLFSLFALIQKHLEKHPRRNLRVAIQLPGLLYAGEKCQIAEVLSLSCHGLLVRTCFRLAEGERLRVLIPLVGMKKELELEGRILYLIEPGPGNNYFQGIGIGFTDMNEENSRSLGEFLEQRFLGDLADRPGAAQLLDAEQIRDRGREPTLRLGPA